MTALTVYNSDGTLAGDTLTDFKQIQQALSEIDVQFERWEANQPLAADAGQDEVLAAYRESVDRLNEKYGFQSVDVVALLPPVAGG